MRTKLDIYVFITIENIICCYLLISYVQQCLLNVVTLTINIKNNKFFILYELFYYPC